MYLYSFEKLEVWQNARDLVKEIYQATSKFPSEEKFGLTNQIRRATTGIAANIAEGTSRKTTKEQARFINIAFSTAIEVINFLVLANDLQFLNDEEYLKLREMTGKITNQLNSLIIQLKKTAVNSDKYLND